MLLPESSSCQLSGKAYIHEDSSHVGSQAYSDRVKAKLTERNPYLHTHLTNASEINIFAADVLFPLNLI